MKFEMPKHKEIDISKWIRKTSYEYFSTFSNPTYSFNKTMDITGIYNYSKKNKSSIFINLLYLITLSLNEIPAFRLRIYNKKIYEYESIYPAFTVMTKTGQFENCYCPFDKDYKKFYKYASEAIEKGKNQNFIKDSYNDSPYFDQFYITCIPWMEFNAMTHPIPDKNIGCMSVPRICWDKFHIDSKSKKVTMNLNITVSHVLMDGKHLSDGFNNFQEKLDDFKKFIS